MLSAIHKFLKSPCCVRAQQQQNTSDNDDSELADSKSAKIFRSGWLCSEELTRKLRPIMTRAADLENRENRNNTNSFLPHVTLFTGSELSEKDCKKVFGLFKKVFPQGLQLQVKAFLENRNVNPPMQLIFAPRFDRDAQQLSTFAERVKSQLGLDVAVSDHWLHATLMYKTIPHEILEKTIDLTGSQAKNLMNHTLLFDQHAITTGRAWEPEAIAAWANVKPRSLYANDFVSSKNRSS